MNKSLLRQVGRNITLTAFLFSSFASAKLLAETSLETLPQCKMQLTTNASLTLGEPVILHAEMLNPSEEQKLWVRTGLYQSDWYTLSLVDQWGRSEAAIPDLRTREPAGAHGFDITIVQPSSSVPIDIVATRFLPIVRPGKYFLKVHVYTSYTQTEAASEDVTQAQGQIKSGKSILAEDFTFPLTVTPADPVSLQNKANELKQDILKKPGSKSHYADIDALFSMSEVVAWTAWQSLADEGNSSTQEIVADKLANLHSSKAVDILFRMKDNPTSNSEIISTKLSEIYNAGDPVLRDHIKAVAAEKGITLPEKIALPQVID